MNFFILACVSFLVLCSGCKQESPMPKQSEFTSYINENTVKEPPETNAIINVAF